MSRHHPSVRSRKQHFPRTDRKRTSGSTSGSNNSMQDESLPVESDHCYSVSNPPPKRPLQKPTPAYIPKSASSNSLTDFDEVPISAIRMDRKARDEHNEQERSRRRELAIIYELIRCSFTTHDLRFLSSDECPRSIDRLSYPQVLHVAYHIMKEEQHNMALYEKALGTIDRLEKEMKKVGMTVPKRPPFISPMESYYKIIQVVDALLRHDKSARGPDGSYEVTTTERAAMGNRQLNFLRQRRLAFYARGSNHSSAHYGPRAAMRRRPLRRQHYARSDEVPGLSSPLGTEGPTTMWAGTQHKLTRPASMGSLVYATMDESHSPSDHNMQESVSNVDILSSLDDFVGESSDSVSGVKQNFKHGNSVTPPHFT